MSNKRYDMETPVFERLELRLLYVSCAKFEDDWDSLPHAHHGTEIFYVTSGQGEFIVEELRFPVTLGDMVIINRNIAHTEIGLGQSSLEYIVMGMDGAEFLFKEEHDSRFCVFQCGTDGKRILLYLQNILKELACQQEYYGQAVQNWLGLLALELMRHRKLKIKAQPAQKTSANCAMIKRYIDSHYTETITLDTLASFSHLNKYYLGHIFAKEMGISPINYLIQRRLEDARHLLLNTDYTIVQISQILGFSSASYFSQCFKREEKTSPKEFRNNRQKK